MDENSLRDLDFQSVGPNLSRGQGALHGADKISLTKLGWRDVHRDDEVRPSRRLATGGVQHPVADRNDQAALLGHGDELGRGNRAAVGMPPAQKRLDAEHGGRIERNLRLIVNRKLVRHRARAAMPFPAPCGGAASGPCRPRRSRRDCDRRTSPDRERYPRSARFWRCRGRQPGSARPRCWHRPRLPSRRPGRDRQGWPECARTVSARRCVLAMPVTSTANSSPPSRATRSVSRTQLRRRSAQSHQHLVAGRMAQTVVDFLEAIEVDAEHRGPLAAAVHALQDLGQMVVEGQAGWAIW